MNVKLDNFPKLLDHWFFLNIDIASSSLLMSEKRTSPITCNLELCALDSYSLVLIAILFA
jgi:hypothetical protein